jgi:hypothetical protein
VSPSTREVTDWSNQMSNQPCSSPLLAGQSEQGLCTVPQSFSARYLQDGSIYGGSIQNELGTDQFVMRSSYSPTFRLQCGRSNWNV